MKIRQFLLRKKNINKEKRNCRIFYIQCRKTESRASPKTKNQEKKQRKLKSYNLNENVETSEGAKRKNGVN